MPSFVGGELSFLKLGSGYDGCVPIFFLKANIAKSLNCELGAIDWN